MTVRKRAKTVTVFMLTIKKAPNVIINIRGFFTLFGINLVVLLALEISGHKQCCTHMHK